MPKTLGYIYFDDMKWFITKVELLSDYKDDYAKLKIYLPHSRDNERVITKELIINSHDLLWSIVENLQKRYPNAVYWRTKRQREILHSKRY